MGTSKLLLCRAFGAFGIKFAQFCTILLKNGHFYPTFPVFIVNILIKINEFIYFIYLYKYFAKKTGKSGIVGFLLKIVQKRQKKENNM